MAQKSKPAAKGSVKSKASPSRAPAKKKKTTAKAATKASAKPAAKATAKKAAAKSTPKVKAKAAASARPAPKPAPAQTPAKTAAEPQIARAKSALKRQKPSVEGASTTSPEAKPERARARKITIEINPNEAASALAAKWTTLYKRAEQIEAKPYNMTAMFEERTAIVHKVLGWGYILTNRNDRLEVLFKDGIKYLISNYKP